MSADSQGNRAARRQTYIQLRMDSMIEQYRQQRQRRWLPSLTSYTANSTGLQESVTRCVNFLRFSVTCCAGAVNAMAPWALAAAEAATVLLIYCTAVPDALIVRLPLSQYHYHFDSSCEDVVLLSLLRFAVVLAAYLLGAGPQYQRPYLYAAVISGALSLPFVLIKTAMLQHSSLHRTQWPSHLAIYAAHAGFSIAHMVAAQRVVTWAQRRYEMGLLGFGYPWEEGEQTWLLAGRLGVGGLRRPAAELAPPATAEDGRGTPAHHEVHDVPAEELADEDSQFLEDCQGLQVHYKMALPQGSYHPGETAILLIHGFGGGTFSWRHILQPLADTAGLAVVAFDRPGFGLTSRPEVAPKTPLEDNPYSLKFQAVLTLKLAWQLGLRRVLLVGHEDGALLALMAAAMACREEQRFSFSPARAAATLPAQPSPVPFPCLVPRSPVRPVVQPSIPQSMDAAWEGWLAKEGNQGFLQRLLRGDFSPSPTNSLLGVGGLAAHPLAQQRWQQRGQQGQQQMTTTRSPWLHLYSMDSVDWQQEGGQEHAWWVQPGHGPPPGYAVLPEGEEEDGCRILPRSTDTSPPHSVGSRRHELGWAVAQQAQQHALHERLLQQQQQAQQQPWGQAGASISTGGAVGRAGGGGGSSSCLHQQLLTGKGSPSAGGLSAGAVGAAHKAPVQQLMEALMRAHANGAAGAEAAHATNGTAAPAQQALPTVDGAGEPAPVASEPCSSLPLESPISAIVAQHAHWLHPQPSQQHAQHAQHTQQPHQRDLDLESPGWHVPGWQLPLAVGVVLLHPDLSGQVAPRYARVLGASMLGRHVLRMLLRTEVGEVSNRRAWCDDSHLTPELLELYKRPLQVVDWDKALTEVCRAKNEMHWVERGHLLGLIASSGLPVLVMTGDRDHMSTPAAAAALSERLPGSRLAVLPGCGHLAHEEQPHRLLDFLAAFVRDVAMEGEGPGVVGAGPGAGAGAAEAEAGAPEGPMWA